MIRFYEGNIGKNFPINNTVFSDSITFGENIWKDGREYFKRKCQYGVMNVQMLPVEDGDHETIAYAYQDDEANRELRMLRELEMHKDALQWKDIFPEIKEVVVCGCNELAFYFVKYLEKQYIDVTVTGQYWKWFGYADETNTELGGVNRLVVYAEGANSQMGDLYKTMIRSASPEFECIDKIYEANVRTGKVRDTKGDLLSVLERLRGKDVVILGTDERSQDTYDFLVKYGIDIFCFAKQINITEKRKVYAENPIKASCSNMLLGKRVMEIPDIICLEKDVVFIDCNGKNSAWGTENVEKFDYYGYARNERFFLMRDYTDIPFSNLVHVLKGKSICLTGDERLCRMISDYLGDVEQGEVDTRYVKLSQYTFEASKEKLLFVVYPLYVSIPAEGEVRPSYPKFDELAEELLSMKDISYSNYFSRTSALVLIDGHLNRKRKKYSIEQFIPKGIFLGRIDPFCGNVFLRSILDGHPNIVKWGFNIMNNNLFLYCIRLANEKSENIMKSFKRLFMEELAFIDGEIPSWGIFEKNMEILLSVKDNFSSQELFVIFHIAYAEMMDAEKITDVNDKIIYWEPHNFPRNEIPYLAQWLSDEKINGQTICMHRDNIVKSGSMRRAFYNQGGFDVLSMHNVMEMNNLSEQKTNRNWKEFHVRFEDIKLHPEQELMEICDRLGIPWSDTLLHSTHFGNTWVWERSVKDFDLRPVFNNYEECLSAFDRFRISLIARSYQKRYGYAYEDGMKFRRSELQEMFLKDFRFQERIQFKNEKEKAAYYLSTYVIIRWDLWEERKHEVMDDIIPMFGQVELYESGYKERLRTESIQKITDFAKHQENLVLYGTGKDCEALLERLGEDRPKLVFCDLKAICQDVIFQGEKVIAPTELNGQYGNHKILITSSRYYSTIQDQLEHLFDISPDRIICNTYQLWEDEE